MLPTYYYASDWNYICTGEYNLGTLRTDAPFWGKPLITIIFYD
jgi:hypothetical protein